MISAVMAIGGYAWYYQQYRAFHARYDRLMNAGVIVEGTLPVMPRVLTLVGLLVLLCVLATSISVLASRKKKAK